MKHNTIILEKKWNPIFYFSLIITLSLVFLRLKSARLCCLLSCDIFVIQRNDKNLENIYSHDAIDSCKRWRAYSPLPKIEFQVRCHKVQYRPVIHILWLSISSMSYLSTVYSFFLVNHWYWSKYFLSTTEKQWRSPMVSITIIALKKRREVCLINIYFIINIQNEEKI